MTTPTPPDDFDAPLLGRALRRPFSRSAGRLLGGTAAALLLGGIAFVIAREPDRGGAVIAKIVRVAGPRAVAEATPAATPARNGIAKVIEVPPRADAAPAGESSASQIEGASGVKVVRPAGSAAPGALVIDVPKALAIGLSPGGEGALEETSPFGPLPRIAADGRRPDEAYSAPVVTPPGLPPGAPRLAIVIGGMGLDPAATDAAIRDLPSAVSLAFAPYGARLSESAARAREAGHETLLQLPMEPLDAAQMPGPHTLRAGAAAAGNGEALHWLLGRFAGYAGVTDYLGGKFTSDPAALTPTLREIASRGLFYLDDGSSPRSVATALAPSLGLRAGAAAPLDLDPRPRGVEGAMARLELAARRDGAA
ncbi:MAG: divergent polysaccharide deacetylase family protein, partial [Hyphomicrobiales bacterium]|nr:divergent polysaccharide deacetylase family protein [Hyphomicrobiales bacterium]